MELSSYFTDFLADIRPTSNQRTELSSSHATLRKRLAEDSTLSQCIVCTFLQGSQRRATAIRPKGDKRSDVDVVVVTRLSKDEYTPEAAMDLFVPFLDKHYKGKWERQGRSFGISLSHVDLDLVITAAPSESEIGIYEADSVTTEDTPEEVNDWRLNKAWVSLAHRTAWSTSFKLKEAARQPEWKLEPLLIPDRDKDCWDPTHPLAQIAWTWEKNRLCNGHYVNVVKPIKWWRRVNHQTPKYPKGYPIEHLVGQCCPDEITSVAQGVTLTLETIASKYKVYADLKIVPSLPDHGVPSHNVLHRITADDFAAFHEQVCAAAKIARSALDAETIDESADKWIELFGDKFPKPRSTTKENGVYGSTIGGFTPRTNESTVGGGRFA